MRGFRIELGEIEARARAARRACAQCVVAAREDTPGDQRLVAYVRAATSADARSGASCARYAAQHAARVHGARRLRRARALPLTPNGKVDRKALPAPCEPARRRRRATSAPRRRARPRRASPHLARGARTSTRVGSHDNFFDLGGALAAAGPGAARDLQTRARPRRCRSSSSSSTRPSARWRRILELGASIRRTTGTASAGARRKAALRRRAAHDEGHAQCLPHAIAIVGMAGALSRRARRSTSSGATCATGVESLETFSDDAELARAGVDPRAAAPIRTTCRRGTRARRRRRFDAAFFGFTPREAAVLDPQQRIFLECAWEALEDAGYDAGSADRASVGVYAGAGLNTYLLAQPAARIRTLAARSGALSADDRQRQGLPRHARVLQARTCAGPSVNVQTACSTSLVAVHWPARACSTGECDMALAGGVVDRASRSSAGYLYQEGDDPVARRPLPRVRRRRARHRRRQRRGHRGAQAPGDALADGDTIHAVILGSAVNNDGAAEGRLHRAERRRPGRGDRHGAGDRRGRPRNHRLHRGARHRHAARRSDRGRGADQVFRAHTDAVAVLRDRLGQEQHRPLDAAAGVAGLIKTVLALEHGEIPPSLQFRGAQPADRFRGAARSSSSAAAAAGTARGRRRGAPASAPSASAARMRTWCSKRPPPFRRPSRAESDQVLVL